MHAGFEKILFAEPLRARANVELLRPRLAPTLFSLLPIILEQVPDADTSLNTLERFSRETTPADLDALARQPALLHYLLALFSHSRFLSETLLQQPDLIGWLGRDRNLARLKSKEDLLEEYARFETRALDTEPTLTMARFKRREYLRIALKDILGIAELAETTLELSTLADVLLEKALEVAQKELRQRLGTPQTVDRQGRVALGRFAVVSLGKLGGKELNYSSDIDLLFLYAGEGETSGPRRIANSEFFIRLAQRLLQLISGVTREGAVFRVDLRLRPGGGEGDLAISLPTAREYYRRQAREWELQMLLKARHSAGDPALVREFLAAVEPLLYRGEMHFAAVETVLTARGQFDRKLEARERRRDALNVKLSPGGIRDIEFLVQCLQRLHGQTDPWVRAGGTLLGLQKLFDKGYLSARDHFRLAAAYQFLRRVEHRLQLEQGHQTHTVPERPAEMVLLARRCSAASESMPAGEKSSLEETPAFQELLRNHLRQVREIYERNLPREKPPTQTEEFRLRPPAVLTSDEQDYASLLDFLRTQSSPLHVVLQELTVPEPARRRLHRWLAAAVGSSSTFEQVNRAAAALPCAVEILRLSEPIGEMLVRHPERIADLTGSSGEGSEETPAFQEFTRSSSSRLIPSPLESVLSEAESTIERLDLLRRYFRDRTFAWGARELGRVHGLEAGLGAYTALVEEMLEGGLKVAQEEKEVGPLPWAVIGLGRLGTAEMDLASDADLVFLAASPEVQQRGRPVAEKLLHVLSAYTREGTVVAADVRLRPRGAEGELVQTAESVLDYFTSTAEPWEAATYLKARPVAGDRAWGHTICDRLSKLLGQRFGAQPELRATLGEMRERLEREAASADNFKTGAGGFYDLDFLLAVQALEAGGVSLANQNLAASLEKLAGEGGLNGGELRALVPAAQVLRAADHAIRLVTGRATAQLPTGWQGEAVAELAGRWLGESLSPALLAVRVRESRARIRESYTQFFHASLGRT